MGVAQVSLLKVCIFPILALCILWLGTNTTYVKMLFIFDYIFKLKCE